MLFQCAFGLTALALTLQWVVISATNTTAHPSTAHPSTAAPSTAAPTTAGPTTAAPLPPPPVVTTANGNVTGLYIPFNMIVPDAPGLADWFFGIPYAQPPVGNLRLEKPLPANNWGSLDGTNPYSTLPCYNQHSPSGAFAAAGIVWTEDCLKLNIYRPSYLMGTNANSKLPVLVYIHTGGWGVGGLLVEGPYGFNGIYVTQGIIVVHMAYRLTLFGFFSDGTCDNPGNLGLWDQQLALKWISNNIAAFGGDPNKITIWGESAGGASVAFHTVNSDSNKLFAQAIQQSGSWNSPWALSQKSIPVSLAAAKTLGCSGVGARLKACMKNLTADAIQQQLNTVPYADLDFNFVAYTPRLDFDFFKAPVGQLLQSAPKKPTLSGFNSDESIILTINYPDPAFNVTSNWTVWDPSSFNRQSLVNWINNNIQSSLSILGPISCVSAVRQQLINQYANVPVTGNATNFWLKQYTRLFTDIQFIVPILWENRLKAQSGWTVYQYHFNHVDPVLADTLPYTSIQHTGEYPYVIGVNLFGVQNLSATPQLQTQQVLASGYVNFVKTGSPNGASNSGQWPKLSEPQNSRNPPCSGTSSYSALLVQPSPVLENPSSDSQNVTGRLKFWDNLAAKYNLDLLKSFPGTQSQCVAGLGAALSCILG